jgi:hypothetical protein
MKPASTSSALTSADGQQHESAERAVIDYAAKVITDRVPELAKSTIDGKPYGGGDSMAFAIADALARYGLLSGRFECPDCIKYEKHLRVCNDQRDELRSALKLSIGHIEHMARWIEAQRNGYSFESLGEDMPGIRASRDKAEQVLR